MAEGASRLYLPVLLSFESMARAAFLFGSGISLASGAPRVDTITNLVLGQSDDPAVACAQAFLKLVKAEIDTHLLEQENREANYEDLYAASYQIFQDQKEDITSPLIWRSMEALQNASVEIQRAVPTRGQPTQFLDLLLTANEWIQGAVWQSLRPVTEPKGLSVVAEVAASTETMDVFTLNHDLLLENLFAQSSIPFSDGFAQEDNDFTRFNWSWKSSDKVRLLKLHGSINWFRFDFTNEGKTTRQYARVVGDHRDARPAAGRAMEVDDQPAVLTGTTVKEQTYGLYLFGEIFSKFRRYLSKHDTIIVSGYGWGDKGINHRLNQWLGDGDDHRIVILHNNPDEVLAEKRFWSGRWGWYSETGKVVLVEKWLSECTLADLAPYFDRRPAPPHC